jgi:ribosome biogenesis GTPase
LQLDLQTLGWSAALSDALDKLSLPDVPAARVVRVDRASVQVLGVDGERTAHLPGRFREEGVQLAVGDWVACEPLVGPDRKAVVRALLPRRTVFTRKVASTGGRNTADQVVVANVDTLFLMSGLDRDFNVRRLERYIALTAECGAEPVVVLNKCDLAEARSVDVDRCVAMAELSAPGIAVHAVSATDGTGMPALERYLTSGATVALLGSSGVGKSTLVNRLSGDARMVIQESRQHDHRGRHTTSHRELLPLPGGASLIDTPGMRELALWAQGDSVDEGFPDVMVAAAQCRFRDCSHQSEPGCGVWTAVERGELDAARVDAYDKLQREVAHLELKQNEQKRREKGRKLNALYTRAQPQAQTDSRGGLIVVVLFAVLVIIVVIIVVIVVIVPLGALVVPRRSLAFLARRGDLGDPFFERREVGLGECPLGVHREVVLVGHLPLFDALPGFTQLVGAGAVAVFIPLREIELLASLVHVVGDPP